MTFSKLFFLVLVFCFASIETIQAEETDQFTLPPHELFDLGPIASQRATEILIKVVSRTNSEIQALLPRAAHSRHAATELALRLNGSYIADLFFEQTGPGFPRWLRLDQFAKQKMAIHFKEIRPWKTVYWLAFSPNITSLIGLAPTINMFGHYMGTDKLGHFFMQGHTYYKLYTYFINHGKSAEQAHNALVKFGQFIEQSYLGSLINGIYSNADMSANYAGWKFYMNLTQSVKLGNKTLAPILILEGKQWQFSKQFNKSNLLESFFSDHQNEAFNPSHYLYSRSQILRQVQKRCPDWIERKGLTKPFVIAKLAEMGNWYGETYGHWLPESRAITLETCFGS